MSRKVAKVTSASPDWPVLRQSPGIKGIWGDYEFHFDDSIEECDYWFVLGGLLKEETARCPLGNTFFIATEPPSIIRFRSDFLRQFGNVLTSDRATKHPNVIFGQQGLEWHVGLRMEKDMGTKGLDGKNKDYDELMSIKGYKKDRLISVISSKKAFTKFHKMRIAFVERLSAHFGEKMDVFGRGIRNIADKWDALASYKYHVALENCSIPDYWTEKLADPYLAGAYPIYYGCTNLTDYFPEGAFTRIDMERPEEAIDIIERTLAEGIYERSTGDIMKARDLVLNKFQIFPLMAGLCDGRPPTTGKDRVMVTLAPMDERFIALRMASKLWKRLGGKR